MPPASPLSDFIEDSHTEKYPKIRSKKAKKVTLGGFLLLIPSLSTTLAGQITVGSGAIEFGQGSQTTAVCDTSINVAIASTYSSANSFFRVSSITLSNVDLTAAGCLNKTLTVKALDSSGTELDLNGSGTSGTALTSTTTTAGTATDSIALTPTGDVNSTLVSRVLIETSQ